MGEREAENRWRNFNVVEVSGEGTRGSSKGSQKSLEKSREDVPIKTEKSRKLQKVEKQIEGLLYDISNKRKQKEGGVKNMVAIYKIGELGGVVHHPKQVLELVGSWGASLRFVERLVLGGGRT